MFKINEGKGFFVQFANGYSISVQFGYGAYCDNRFGMNDNFDWKNFAENERKLGEKGSGTAEIAVMKPDGEFCGEELGIFEHDSIEGWCTANRVLEVMNIIAAIGDDDAVD